MNKLFTLCPISDKPDVNGTYHFFKKDGSYFAPNDYNPRNYGEQHGGWLMYNNPKTVTHYLKPLVPPATAQEAAKDHVDKFCAPVYYHSEACHKAAFASFLSGVSWQMAQGWVSEKPKFDKECVFVTARLLKPKNQKPYWDYSVWQLALTDGVNMNDQPAMYLALCDESGDEWGDLADLVADRWLIISEPSPPNQ